MAPSAAQRSTPHTAQRAEGMQPPLRALPPLPLHRRGPVHSQKKQKSPQATTISCTAPMRATMDETRQKMLSASSQKRLQSTGAERGQAQGLSVGRAAWGWH